MKNTVIFRNDGEIDLNAALTFGMSAKVKDDPVGFFGTGLKYAISIILRNGGSIAIYVGTKKHNFKLREEKDRNGDTHQVIYMGNRRLPFTTRLGITWEPWQAFRELYCNMHDEGGYASTSSVKPKEGTTTIIVDKCEPFFAAYENRSTFILQTEPIYSGVRAEVHAGESRFVFYRGIRVMELQHPTKYTWNLTTQQVLTEDRTLKFSWPAEAAIVNTLLTMRDTPIAKNILYDSLIAEPGYDEHRYSYKVVEPKPNKVFMEMVAELRRGGKSGLLNNSARDLHDRHSAAEGNPEEVALTAEEQKMLDKAWERMPRMGFRAEDVEDKNIMVIPVNSLGQGVLGMANKNKVFISKRAFSYGQDVVTGTLFEELCHALLDMEDESRDFQNFLINTCARLA